MTSLSLNGSNQKSPFSGSVFGFGASRANDYEALPLAEEEQQVSSSIRCRAHKSALYINQKDIRDEQHLESFIRQYKPCPPRLSLRITGFRAPRSTEQPDPFGEDGVRFQIFNFTVPLPAPSASSYLLYSKAHSIPCLRGRLHQAYLLERLGEVGWPTEAVTGCQIYDEISRQPLQASKMVMDTYNSRVKKLVQPWLSLEERPGDESGSEGENEDRKKADRTLKQNLRNFLNQKTRSKWLICPQTPYGWDVVSIMEPIRSLVPEETSSSSSIEDNQPAPISHIKVSVDPLPPFLAIRAVSNLNQLLIFQPALEDFITPLSIGLSFAVFILDISVVISCTPDKGAVCGTDGKSWFPAHWALWLPNLLLPLVLFLWFMLYETGHVHDGVGIAWNLKAAGSEGGASCTEREWVERHSNLLKRAIKERRYGDLRSEWPED